LLIRIDILLQPKLYKLKKNFSSYTVGVGIALLGSGGQWGSGGEAPKLGNFYNFFKI